MLFDSHAHVHVAAFDADRPETLARAREAGVERILTVGTDLGDSMAALAVAAEFELDASVGVHPHEAKDAPDDLAAALDRLIAEGPSQPRAVGETGLDYYYDYSPRDVQRRVCAVQVRYARERGLPLIFHHRDAYEDFLAILRAEFAPGMRGVVHCFTGDSAQARTYVSEFALKLGIGGIATFKNARPIREAIVAVGLEHIILETDAPYLAPVPHRGQRNEPAFVRATAACVAELLGVSLEEVAAQTSATAAALFGG